MLTPTLARNIKPGDRITLADEHAVTITNAATCRGITQLQWVDDDRPRYWQGDPTTILDAVA